MGTHHMGRLRRILRHRWHDERDASRALDAAALARLEAQVVASEQRHSGEIRICVEAGLPLSYLWRHAGARERAVTQFGKLRVWDTEHNNGVLIYLLLADRAIEIVADRGLAPYAGAEHWRSLIGTLGSALRTGRFEQGLERAVADVDALLVRHFPLAPGEANPNQLPDRPVVG